MSKSITQQKMQPMLLGQWNNGDMELVLKIPETSALNVIMDLKKKPESDVWLVHSNKLYICHFQICSYFNIQLVLVLNLIGIHTINDNLELSQCLYSKIHIKECVTEYNVHENS